MAAKQAGLFLPAAGLFLPAATGDSLVPLLAVLVALLAAGLLFYRYRVRRLERQIDRLQKTALLQQENEAKYRLLFEAAGDAIYIHDESGPVLAANSRGIEQLGYTLAELRSMTLAQVLAPDQRGHIPEWIGRLMQQGHCEFETVHQRKDGSLIPVEVSARRITWDGLPAVLSTCRDGTQRKRAEEAVRASTARLEALIQASPLAITMVDTQGLVQLWNAAAEQIFGWSAQEIIGRPYPLVSPDQRAEYARVLNQLDQGNAPVNYESLRQRKDGSLVEVNISSAPVQAGDGRVIASMAIIADISERKAMERALQQRNQEMATLYETSLEITALSDLSVLLNTIVQRACALLHLTLGVLHLVRPEEAVLETVAGYQLPPDWIGRKFRLDQGLAGRVVQTKKPFMVPDYLTWAGRLEVFADSPARRSLGIPIIAHNEVIGVLVLLDHHVGTFDEGEIRLVSLFAGQAAIAIENARLYAQVHQLAVTDGLTGLFNRLFFDAEMIRIEVGRDYPVSIIVADLDNMKVTNDTLGHATGDVLVRNMARLLQQTFRAGDIIARIGGDEYAVLLPHTDAPTVQQMLARVHTNLAEYNRLHPDLPIQVSLGAATAQPGKLAEALVIADQRMYAEKAARKSAVQE